MLLPPIPNYADLKARRKIAIYAGKGAKLAEITAHSLRGEVDEAVNPVCYIYPADIAHGRLRDDTALLVFPGGEDRFYCRDLNGEPTDIIRDFGLHKSTLYICAGTYFASEGMEYSDGISPQVVEPRQLGLFPGMAIGAYSEFAGPYDGQIGSISAPMVRLADDSILPMYYHGGCTLRPSPGHKFGRPDSPLSAIGCFDQLPGRPACIARVNHAEGGKSFLSGVHLELPGPYVHDLFKTVSKARGRMHIAESLRAAEPRRRALQRSILAGCGVKLAPVPQFKVLNWLERYCPAQGLVAAAVA